MEKRLLLLASESVICPSFRIPVICTFLLLALCLGPLPLRGNPFPQRDDASTLVKHFRAAQKATQEGRLEAAASEYLEVLQLRPQLVEARTNLGLVYYMLGQYQQAASQFSLALKQQPDLLPANVFLGISHLKLGRLEEAIPFLKQALLTEPSNLEARRALARSYLDLKRFPEAVKEFRAFFSHTSDKTEAWFQLGRDYLRLSQRLASWMARDHQDSAWGRRFAGDLLSRSGRWKEAEQWYREALTADPDQPGLRSSLGNAYLRQAKLQEAEMVFQAELQMNPKSPPALLGLAALDLAEANPGSAQERLTEIWEIFPEFLLQPVEFPLVGLPQAEREKLVAELERLPGSPGIHFLLSFLYREAGKEDLASQHALSLRDYFEKSAGPGAMAASLQTAEQLCQAHRYRACLQLLDSGSSSDSVDLLRGRAHRALGQLQEASDALARAMGVPGDRQEALFWLIDTYRMLADISFRKVEELSPNSWRVQQLQAETYSFRQEDDEAIQAYQRAIQLQPGQAELHEALGKLYLLNNSMVEARAELEKALQLEPSRSRSLYLLGRSYADRRQWGESIPYLEKSLRFDPGLLEAHAALGKAYFGMGESARAVSELEQAREIDHDGSTHYLLFQAYRRLGEKDLAESALARSKEIKESSFARDRAQFERWFQ